MTPEEYLDSKRFPLTTQGGLSLKGQMFIDAFNRDALMGMAEDGLPMDMDQLQRFNELNQKVAAFRGLGLRS